jgi:hypothetical protein
MKLFWRQPGARGPWHCYRKYRLQCYETLCGRGLPLPKIGGTAVDRPDPSSRCPACDGLEATQQGWRAPGPVSVGRRS